MTFARIRSLMIPALLLIATASPARAEESWWQTDQFMQQRHLFEVGLFLGAFFPPDDHGLYNQRFYENFRQRPFQSAAFDIGLRVSYLPLPYLGVEVEGALMPTSAADGGGSALAFNRV